MPRLFDNTKSHRAVSTTTPVAAFPLTFSAWVRPTTARTQTAVALDTGANSGSGYLIGGVLSTGAGFVEAGTTDVASSDTSDFPAGEWHLLTVTVNSSGSCTVYRDGVSRVVGTVSTETLTHVSVGCLDLNAGGLTSFFNGDIGQVGLWNVALSGADVTALVTATPNAVNAASLVGYWDFLDTSPTIEPDRVGSRNLALQGSGAGEYPHPSSASTPVDPSGTAPANTTAPHITTDGTPQIGETVACSDGTWTGFPAPTLAKQWKRNTGSGFTNIAGATSSSYLLATGDLGATVKCTVAATNASGTASQDSDNTITPTAPSPVNTGAPTITPATGVHTGDVVTVSAGTWANTPTSFSFQFQRNSGSGFANVGAPISDVDGTITYTAIVADEGRPIRFVATAINGAGSSTPVATNAITVTSGAPVNLSGTVTDPLGASSADTAVLQVSDVGGLSTLKVSLLGTRVVWGSAIDQGGAVAPSFGQEVSAVTLGVVFYLRWNCRITGGRIYKAPNLAGLIPVVMWSSNGTKLAETTISMVVDGGGWVDFEFPTPVAATIDGGPYTISYFSSSAIFALSPWIWHAQDWVNHPFYVPMFRDNTQGRFDGSTYVIAATHTFPTEHTASQYYIDVDAEWDVTTPTYNGGTDYFDQWVNGTSAKPFPVGVFFADPEFLEDYASIGVDTLVGGAISDSYIAAVKASGVDWWPTVELPTAVTGSVSDVVEDSDLGQHVRGYFIGDEPDLIQLDPVGYRSPQYFRDLRNLIRVRDSSRPVMINLGKWPPYNMGFAYLPAGATIEQANYAWREYGKYSDMMSIDWYNMTTDQSFGTFGIWTYPLIVRRMIELSDNRVPVWGYVETTAQTPNEPTPTQVYRATWACLIGGARGIIFFDHRFGDSDVTQDFAALLHDTPMRTMVQSIATQLKSLSDALYAPDAGLVTGYTSSGTLAAAKGGYAAGAKIPVHYTSRVVGTTSYVFAQAIRPGATTATITVPSAAGKTVTVIGEARAVTPNGSGTFSDTFAADYGVHLYSWTNSGGGGGGGTDPLGALSRVAWEGGPDYWTVARSGSEMTKAEAAGWSDPAFFPIGVWLSPTENVTDLQAVGINVMVGADTNHDPPSTATAEGMFVLPQIGEWTTAEVGSDPLCVGWHVWDEPELYTTLSAYQASVANARALADGRFIHTNFAQVILNTHWWTGIASDAFAVPDLASVDHYYYSGAEIRYNTAENPADGWPLASDQDLAKVSAAYGWAVDRMRHWGGPVRPYWNYVETQLPFLSSSVGLRNIILYAQIAGAVWASIIHEARGILYFQQNGFYNQAGAPTIDPNTGTAPNTNLFSLINGDLALRNYVAALNAKITALAPVLNTQSYVWSFGASGIDTMLKSHGGYAYIFAGVGLGGTAGTKTFTLPTPITATSIEVVNESRTLTASGGQFTDSFAQEYTVHIYRVALPT